MLQLVRNSNPLSLLLIVLYAFLIRCPMLFHSSIHVAVDYSQPLSFLTDELCKVSVSNLWIHYLASTTLILIVAFYFNFVLTNNKIVEKNGFLPALLFILIASFFTDFNFISNVVLSFFFVFIAVMILYGTLLNDNKHSGLFDAGFFISLGALIYKPIFLLIFFLLAAVILLRSVQFRDLLITLIGCFVPVFLMGTYCFMIDRFSFFYTHLLPSITTSIDILKEEELLEYVKVIILAILVGFGILKGQSESIKTIVTVRKFYSICLLLMIGLLLSFFFSHSLQLTSFLFLAIPFSFYLYTILKDFKRMWIAELIHVILAGLIVFTSL